MSLVKLTADKFERFTLVTNPRRTFSSSSAGVTGSIELFARENRIVKEAETFLSTSNFFDETVGVETELTALKNAFAISTDISSETQVYLDAVNEEPLTPRSDKSLPIVRFTPGLLDIDRDGSKKRMVIDTLMPFYRTRYPLSHYAYTNYHTLNFFTASSVPSDSVLIYPNSGSDGNLPYSPSKGFTLDMQINPRYTVDSEGDEFKAGTVLHISSTLALSIVTGSEKGSDGKPTSFRLLLQLSHSADVNPSEIDLSVANNARTYPEDLIFLSSDNVLGLNKWHHVAARWGTSELNEGTGSFVVDNQVQGYFNVPSASIRHAVGAPLCFVGNYYAAPPGNNPGRFFNENASQREGVTQLESGELTPTDFSFDHPLNAEISDIKLYSEYRSLSQILTSSVRGPDDLTNLLFYVPVFFTRETRPRRVVSTLLDYTDSAETFDPFNVDFAFRTGGHILELESFTREFVQGEYPRLYNLTASLYGGSIDTSQTADYHMYSDPLIRKRNLSVLPNDNGKFTPNFQLLRSGSVTSPVTSGSATEKFANDTGGLDLQLINLKSLINDDVLQGSVSGTLAASVYGTSPADLSLARGVVPSIFQLTRDSNSNESVFFDISNLFYGRRILPTTFSIVDQNISASDGKISMTLKDDGVGSLYRADASTEHAKWNSIGNIFYNEGIAVVKSPNIPFFGKDQFEVTMQGEREIYTTKINVLAPAGEINSSSNASYTPLSASLNANDEDSEFVYITNIVFHDENLNVVARTNLAQPIIKRGGDKLLFKVKMDW